jgi:hypothetical protein
MSETQAATAAANISDGLVQGSLPELEPKEYRVFDMMPLVVVTAPSPIAGLPRHVAVALRIITISLISQNFTNSFFIDGSIHEGL